MPPPHSYQGSRRPGNLGFFPGVPFFRGNDNTDAPFPAFAFPVPASSAKGRGEAAYFQRNNPAALAPGFPTLGGLSIAVAEAKAVRCPPRERPVALFGQSVIFIA